MNPLPELLKFKRNPMGLGILALSALMPFAILLFQRLSPKNLEVSSNTSAWLLAAQAVVALLAPYLVTLEPSVQTAKWIRTTPKNLVMVLLDKLGVVLLVAMLGALLALLLGVGQSGDAGNVLRGVAAVLCSLGTMTLLSLLTRNFAAVLVIGFVWMQLVGYIVGALPKGWQEGVAAALPGANITHFGASFDAVRVVATLLIWLGVFLAAKRVA